MIKQMIEGWTRARVIMVEPEGVLLEDGRRCPVRGVLKRERGDDKTLVAVGDWVWLDEAGAVASVEERSSWLGRADSFSGRRQQVIAANVDQVLITVSLVEPPLKPALIDRYLIAAKRGGMAACLVVNKVDLLEQGEEPFWNLVEPLYRGLGVPVVVVSATTGEGLEELRGVMRGRTSVFAGQSGVGKTALINAITGLQLPVGELMRRVAKGSHTTRRSQLIALEGGGWCVDTPGVRSFGLWELTPDEVSGYYDEIHRWSSQCRYPGCSHTQEPGCAVRAAVDRGEIHPLRFDSYLALLNDTRERQKHAY